MLRVARSLAWAAAAAAGLAAVGCAASASAGSVSAAGPPVPASAIPRLDAIADRAAKANDDPGPSWITAVLTTRAKALTSATPGDFVSGSRGVPVFLVTMQGHFTANGSRPSGAAAPAGAYLSLVVDAKTFQQLDFGLSAKPPPVSPASLGPVTYLAGHPH